MPWTAASYNAADAAPAVTTGRLPACQFWIVHLPTSFLLTLLLAGSVWVCFRFLYPVFFIPCTQVLLASFLIERAFKKHLPDSQGK